MARSVAQYGHGIQQTTSRWVPVLSENKWGGDLGSLAPTPDQSDIPIQAAYFLHNTHIKELYSRGIHYLYYAVCTVCVSLALLLMEK